MGAADRIVLNIPHASPVYPFGKSGWGEGIDAEIARWTDWYTDWLFASATRLDSRIVAVQFPFSRFFCDAERLEDDPLEKVGQGIAYRYFGTLQRVLSIEDEALLREIHREHQDRLRKAILSPSTILLDCHSFPSDLSEVEVCIGVNEDWSRPEDEIISMVMECFRHAGYKVAINEPYSNSMSPLCHYPYRSLMLEVNKAIYMNPAGEMTLPNAFKLRGVIERFMLSLL
ncbi:MAG: N-formylglutamate amidohydrolase [Clostridia bacterium]|nr:N-formylglutamate amidohydrolase [Clostridia bacterium]